MKIAFISDIHEDSISLKVSFRKIEKLNVDEIICLGDISGYSMPHYKFLDRRNAHQCLLMIRAHCKYIVLGNHDLNAAKILPKTNSFFNFPENWYELDYLERKGLSKDRIWLHEENDLNPLYSKEDIQFLQTLPESEIIEVNGLKILLSHYAYPNILGLKKEFYLYRNEFKQHFDFMEKMGCMYSFIGHTHTKGFFAVDRKKLRYCKSLKYLEKTPTCIGNPAITSNGKQNGFCIFDSEEFSVQFIKL